MISYYDQRQILSDALCPYLSESICALFPQFKIGGSLLAPDGTPIAPNGSLNEMAQVMSATLTREDDESRYIALVFQPLDSEHPAVSILTDPRSPRHIIHITDDDVRAAIPHLKSLIDETLRELANG